MSEDEGYVISDGLEEAILNLLPHGNSTILELGSGEGTDRLLKNNNVISVEHDENWLIERNPIRFKHQYIYAPLREFKPIKNYDGNIWYDAETLKLALPELTWDLLLVDGPPAERCGLIKYWEMLFDRGVPVIFDDVNRVRDWKVMCGISARLKKPYTVYETWETKHFGVILP